MKMVRYFVSLLIVFCILKIPKEGLAEELPPEANLTVPEIISLYGYLSEIHTTLTSDGYYLETHRIPNKEALRNGQPPLLFLHGLFSGSFAWTLNGKNNSLAYLLHDEYDIWMNNFRGSSYSRRHLNSSITEKEYWNFDISDGLVEDATTLIDYVLNETKAEQLIIVGHSMGNIVTFMLLSSKPEYNSKVKGFLSIATITTMKGMRSTPALLTLSFGPGTISAAKMGIYYYLPIPGPGIEICRSVPLKCHALNFMLEGNISPHYNPKGIPVVYSHYPEHSSGKVAHQMSQLFLLQNFTGFNYGPIGNMEKYNSTWPPFFDIGKVTTKVAILHGTIDNIATPEGAKVIAKQLPNVVERREIYCNHQDFLFAKNLGGLIYPNVGDLLQKLRD